MGCESTSWWRCVGTRSTLSKGCCMFCSEERGVFDAWASRSSSAAGSAPAPVIVAAGTCGSCTSTRHVKAAEQAPERGANAAKADQADRLAVQLHAERVVVAPLARAQAPRH